MSKPAGARPRVGRAGVARGCRLRCATQQLHSGQAGEGVNHSGFGAIRASTIEAPRTRRKRDGWHAHGVGTSMMIRPFSEMDLEAGRRVRWRRGVLRFGSRRVLAKNRVWWNWERNVEPVGVAVR